MHESLPSPLEAIDLKLLGKRLTCVRRSSGLSIGQAMKLSGYTRQQFGEWECGVTRVQPHELLELVELYHCDIMDVLGDMPEFASEKEAIDAYNRDEITDIDLAKFLMVGLEWARMKAGWEKSKTCDHDWIHMGPNSKMCRRCEHCEFNI
jgi:predicted transcriptional regulator